MKSRAYILSITCIYFSLSWSAVGAATTISKYEVTGNTAAELTDSLNANGPNGGWGLTEDNWYTEYKPSEESGKFKIATVTVSRTTTITMPIWRAYTDASRCLKKSWDDMYGKLKMHENKHVEIANIVSNRMKTELKAIPPQDTVEKLYELAAAKLALIEKENQLKQNKFDTDTDHGRNAGKDSVVLKSCV